MNARIVWITGAVLVACGVPPNAPPGDAGSTDAGSIDAGSIDAGSTDAGSDMAFDDFERTTIGPDWTSIFTPATPQVKIIGSSDLGMGAGPQGFFLMNWTKRAFLPDQFCEATIPTDVAPGWAHQVYVRWRASDNARYGFHYNSDPRQPTFNSWAFKYDGVPSAQTRVIASAVATVTPQPGDTLRVEVVGFVLRGYLNGTLVLEATDTDPSRISSGVTGLAARLSTGNTAITADAKVWESWRGGSL